MQVSGPDKMWYDDRVEEYLDGVLDTADRIRFEDRLHQDEGLRTKVDFARRIQTSLSQLPTPEMPDVILANVRRAITASAVSRTKSSQGLRLVSVGVRRLAYSAIAIAACFVLFLVIGPQNSTDDQEQLPTQAEVDRALLEVKQTLAFVSDMGYERTEIVTGHVVEPVQKAMSFIFQSENTADIQ